MPGSAGESQSAGRAEGYHQPGCYAGSLNDCSAKLSREHYISRSILQRIGAHGGMQVGGLKWLPPGQTRQVGPNALTANILCAKHNTALSALDDVGLALFEALDRIGRELADPNASRVSWVRDLDGPMLERWMLKVALGVADGGIAVGVGGVPGSMSTTDYWVRVLFGIEPMPRGCGLYVVRDAGARLIAEQGIEFSARVNDGATTTGPAGEVYGLNITVNGLPFLCNLADPPGSAPLLEHPSLVYRPAGLAYDNGRTVRTVRFLWRDGQRHDQLKLMYHRGPEGQAATAGG